MESGIRTRLTPAEGRKFGFTVGGAFAALSALFWWRDHQIPMGLAGVAAAALILAALVLPARLGPVYAAWMKFGERLSRITSPVFLGVVYFVVLTPVGLVRRRFGSNPLKRAAGATSAWQPRPDEARRSSLERQF